MFGEELRNARLGGREISWLEGAWEEEKFMQKSSSTFQDEIHKKRGLVLLEKRILHLRLLKSPFPCWFLWRCLLSQLLLGTTQNVFLCSALGITILFRFPVVLLLVEFQFSKNIFICITFYAFFLPINCSVERYSEIFTCLFPLAGTCFSACEKHIPFLINVGIQEKFCELRTAKSLPFSV